MPVDYKKYASNWKEISTKIRKRNGGKCELCFAPNGEIVYRPKKEWEYIKPWYFIINSGAESRFKKTKIVLTVHHIDGKPKKVEDPNDANLISLCQRCHLRLHLANKSKRKGVKKCRKEKIKVVAEERR